MRQKYISFAFPNQSLKIYLGLLMGLSLNMYIILVITERCNKIVPTSCQVGMFMVDKEIIQF